MSVLPSPEAPDFTAAIDGWNPVLERRWRLWRDDVLRPLRVLYGGRGDLTNWVAHFLQIVAQAHAARSIPLRALDEDRLLVPDWFQRADQIGYIAYADRFAGTLRGVVDHIPYLQELGVTYLHLMPLLQPREGPNDGGYAVADYRSVDRRLGTMDDLEALTAALRAAGISLCTDLVCNHTATEHDWALRAQAGDPQYQNYYLMFPDRTLPDAYDRTLREVFPEYHRGNFVYHAAFDRWVWTTFNLYQWDLNYHNPAVFGEMLDIILFLANRGVEIVRMDAVAFMWKELGTDCENLPQAHALLQAWRALSRLAAPATLLKAEAIVSPEKVVPYFGRGAGTNKECELAYNNSLMVLLWSALAERNARLIRTSLGNLPAMPRGCAWVNYVRCHDDIGWAITDYNAEAAGLNGWLHRRFLSDFYSGEFDGSFSRGRVFQFNPENYDRRITGSCASLAGLERAIEARDRRLVELAIGRILLIHSMIMAYGGIPLIYMGDELGLLNDYSYADDPARADDSRWVHRPPMDWALAAVRHDLDSIPGQIFRQLQHIISVRKRLFQLHASAHATPVDMHNDQVLGIIRHSPRGRLLILGNFSEQPQSINAGRLREILFGGDLLDHLSGQRLPGGAPIWLAPYQALWLEPLNEF